MRCSLHFAACASLAFLDKTSHPKIEYFVSEPLCACMPAQRGSQVRALTFGAILPDGKRSFPSSPTWMMYGGDDVHCIENTPVLISQHEFCLAFLAEARVFRCASPAVPECLYLFHGQGGNGNHVPLVSCYAALNVVCLAFLSSCCRLPAWSGR